MKILLLSDTHGKIDRAMEVFNVFDHIGMIFHCGDHQSDAEKLRRKLGVPVVSVPGNCDRSFLPVHAYVKTPYGKILLTHGHRENVKENVLLNNYDKLLSIAKRENCAAVCFGHTHIPFFGKMDGIYLINPGSLTLPRDGRGGSFALLDSRAESFSARIIYYDRLCEYIQARKSPPPEADQGKGF